MKSGKPEGTGVVRPGFVSGPRSRIRPESGFSLIELMVSLAVLAILLVIAVPTYRDVIAGQRVRAAISELHTALVLARSEAIKRNTSITLSRSSGNWASGWKIASPVAGQPDLLVHSHVPGVSIETTAASVLFSGSGRVSTSVTFEVSSDIDADDKKTSCLTLGLDGRAASKSGEC